MVYPCFRAGIWQEWNNDRLQNEKELSQIENVFALCCQYMDSERAREEAIAATFWLPLNRRQDELSAEIGHLRRTISHTCRARAIEVNGWKIQMDNMVQNQNQQIEFVRRENLELKEALQLAIERIAKLEESDSRTCNSLELLRERCHTAEQNAWDIRWEIGHEKERKRSLRRELGITFANNNLDVGSELRSESWDPWHSSQRD